MAIKAADMLIARRADTRARADFATWKMLAKLNGFSALPAEAQNFLEGYRQLLLARMTEADASEATIQLMYKSYYAEMGGTGVPPEIPSRASDPVADSGNVTAFRRPPARPKPVASAASAKPRLPVALIFMCLAVVYVSIRYYFR